MTEHSFVADALRATAAELFHGDEPLVTLPELFELGWSELAADDLSVAVSVLAEAQGRHLGVSRLLELAMASALPSFAPQGAALVFAVGPAGRTAFAEEVAVDGIVLADGADAPSLAIPTETSEGICLRVLPVADAELHAVAGIDPDGGVSRVVAGSGGTAVPVGREAWEAAVAVGSLAVAAELLGVSGAMLDLAVAHVRDRHQFGVPIGSFQAVQHRLADVAIDLEAARAVGVTAWLDPEGLVCAAARAAAGLAFETANRHCHQVLGAMGSTWEHPLHRYQRRGLLLSRLLDPTATLRAGVSNAVADHRRVEVLEG
jgi:Acyl-CoA dehydrogenase, C-terminal domain